MSVTDGSKGSVILYKVIVLSLVCPVDGVDRVRLVVAVLHALLVTVEFLTIEDERNALGSVDCCLSELYHCKALLLSSIRSLLKTVTQTVVVVAAHIAHVLERAVGPTLHSHLRMLYTTGDTELDVCLVACNTVHKAGVLATERTAHSVTDVVAECTDLVEHIRVRLKGDLLCRICRRRGCPTLAVDHNIRIYSVETLADEVHSLYVVDGHKVETETVDMVLLHPPLEGLDHIFTEHFLL